MIAQARTLLGTPFRHQGRIIAGRARQSVDCLGLLIAVATECELRGRNGRLLAAYDRTDYSHLPDTSALRFMLDSLLTELPLSHYQIGAIALFNCDNQPQHLGIITDYAHGGFGLIHATAQARKVVEHAFDTSWQQRLVALYTV